MDTRIVMLPSCRRHACHPSTAVLLLVLVSTAGNATEPKSADFEREIAPLLVRRCLECHHATAAAGGLVLTDREGLVRGGDTGPAIVPGQTDESLLFARVRDGEMPPDRQGKPRPLPTEEIARLRTWIDAGAPWPTGRVLELYEATSDVRSGRDWWSLQSVRKPELPRGLVAAEDSNAVDAFIGAKLAAEQLEPAPPAESRTLLRRLYFDLTGLPPAADVVADFAAAPTRSAYEAHVDQLLASPHYGERWARHWLDLVRYADTSGYERDQEKPQAWRYRDWVVNAFNADLPYDQFVREQLAGDELDHPSEQTVVATGFLRLGTWNDEPNDPEEYQYERLEDLVHATSTAFLGLSVKCARCHDHKFDPIPQVDYYRLASAFWPGPITARDRALLGGPTRDELGFDVLGWTDVTRTPQPLKLLRKGDPRHPGPEVAPGYLSLVPALDRPIVSPPPAARTTHRRRQLAAWLVDPQHPLTARVLVNRLWQHHFGQGLVRTPNDFGFNGERPTHPELLDWLADELVRGGWRLKPLHRLLVMSRTYRQSATHPRHDDYVQRDPGNRWWWRAERQRLNAEALRDAMLVASDQLDDRLGGPGFRPTLSAEALEGLSRKSAAWEASLPAEQRRRSLYIYAQRSLLTPLLTTFDFPDTTLPCGQRDVSLVAPQALTLLNNAFVHEQSTALAVRVRQIAGRDHAVQITTAWRLALGRDPTPRELDAAEVHLAAQQDHFARQLRAKVGAQAADHPIPELPPGLVLRLSAGCGVEADSSGRVRAWHDQSGQGHHASQSDPAGRPLLVADGIAQQPVVRFDGQRRFLALAGQVLASQQFTIVAVATDTGMSDHRAILSNWDGGRGNSTSSVFLGLTGDGVVRLSDDFVTPQPLTVRAQPFVLTAISGAGDARIVRDDHLVARKGGPLTPRLLVAPYVVGQQGNIDGEYWHGDLAELLVFDRELSAMEQTDVVIKLMRRYGLRPAAPAATPAELALASLCHVLLNTNEFAYVD